MATLNIIETALPIPVGGGRELAFFQLTCDTDYTTGGYDFAPGDFKMSSIEHVSIEDAGGFAFQFVYATSLIKAYTGDNDAGADGPMAEVAAGANALDGIVTRLMVLGVRE